jgi:hypothetical protein
MLEARLNKDLIETNDKNFQLSTKVWQYIVFQLIAYIFATHTHIVTHQLPQAYTTGIAPTEDGLCSLRVVAHTASNLPGKANKSQRTSDSAAGVNAVEQKVSPMQIVTFKSEVYI